MQPRPHYNRKGPTEPLCLAAENAALDWCWFTRANNCSAVDGCYSCFDSWEVGVDADGIAWTYCVDE